MKTRVMARVLTAALCGVASVLFAAPLSPAGDWPGWRGPLRTGHTDETGGGRR
jgi:hypothetical protein